MKSTQKRCWKHSESANRYRGPTVSSTVSSSCQFICLELFKLSRSSQISLSSSSLDATHTACLFSVQCWKQHTKHKKHYKPIQIQCLIFLATCIGPGYLGAVSHENHWARSHLTAYVGENEWQRLSACMYLKVCVHVCEGAMWMEVSWVQQTEALTRALRFIKKGWTRCLPTKLLLSPSSNVVTLLLSLYIHTVPTHSHSHTHWAWYFTAKKKKMFLSLLVFQ